VKLGASAPIYAPEYAPQNTLFQRRSKQRFSGENRMSGYTSLRDLDTFSPPVVAPGKESTAPLHSVEEAAPAPSVQSRMTERRVDDLQPHPAYVRHHIGVSASKLSALLEVGDLAFREPLVITNASTIIDGHARWEIARLQGHSILPCIEYVLSEEEALQWLILRHGRSDHLNAFCRILLALELEPWLTEQARSHQQAGGQNKGSSKLTEADRLDVRSRIAGVAGASTGNVTKVKQLLAAADPEVLQALRSGEIVIHRAWLWRALPLAEQRRTLMSYRGEKGVGKTIRSLLSEHVSKPPADPIATVEMPNLVRRLSQLDACELSSLAAAVLKFPGKAIFITEDLLKSLPAQEELALP
jgi:hypothetical protein